MEIILAASQIVRLVRRRRPKRPAKIENTIEIEVVKSKSKRTFKCSCVSRCSVYAKRGDAVEKQVSEDSL